jgi:hypothetical protein
MYVYDPQSKSTMSSVHRQVYDSNIDENRLVFVKTDKTVIQFY